MRRTRKGISPFLATVMLVVITLMIGGILYTQFQQLVVSQVKDPSVLVQDMNVAPDGQTITAVIKNDGNVQLTLQTLTVSYDSSSNSFVLGSSGNATMLASSSGSTVLNPGDIFTAQLKTKFTIPTFASFTMTVVSNQVARAFNVQA